uniref:CST complex subunit CTC1 n=1 Tax=Bursaphelenchus xylophilus TaxID=6326 RepID=A0A1I7SFM9_BURXY
MSLPLVVSIEFCHYSDSEEEPSFALALAENDYYMIMAHDSARSLLEEVEIGNRIVLSGFINRGKMDGLHYLSLLATSSIKVLSLRCPCCKLQEMSLDEDHDDY